MSHWPNILFLININFHIHEMVLFSSHLHCHVICICIILRITSHETFVECIVSWNLLNRFSLEQFKFCTCTSFLLHMIRVFEQILLHQRQSKIISRHKSFEFSFKRNSMRNLTECYELNWYSLFQAKLHIQIQYLGI